MYFSFTLLFIITVLAGAMVFVVPKWRGERFDLALIFSGAYLFGITVIHILPELFSGTVSGEIVGSIILVGFFVQIFLEYFTSGVEHGHVHEHDHSRGHTMITSMSLMVALCAHAFMEGTLLAHPSTMHEHHQSNALLIGILLHKVPAAFALMSIITCHFKSRFVVSILLVVFALATPMGLLVSDYVAHNQLISETGFTLIFAFVSGSFLKISTTIFFESNPQHQLSLSKILISSFAAAIAIMAEYIF